MKNFLSLIAFVALAAPANSEVLKLRHAIAAPPGSTMMGSDMAVSDGRAIVSIWRELQNIDTIPALYDIKSGTEDKVLQSEPQATNSQNARAVDIEGSRALVCGDATGYSDPRPSIRMFDAETGALLTAIFHDDPERTSRGRYGQTCKIAGDLILVTDKSFEREGEENRGAVYMYDAATGALVRRILAHAPEPKEHFGTDVVVHGNLIAISTTGADLKRGYHGHVDLYELDSGTHMHRFMRPDNGISYNSGSFGSDLILTEDRLIIGSIFDTLKTKQETGTVWVFDLSDYSLLHRLTPPVSYRDNDLFGLSMSLSGDQLLVGSAYSWSSKKHGGHGKKEAGMAFLFNVATGNLVEEIQNPSPTSGAQFGRAVSLGEWGAAITASKAETDHESEGALFIYDFGGGQ